MRPNFRAGKNIAMKVPTHEYDGTIAFYRDVLGLKECGPNPAGEVEAVSFEFGDKKLWIDRIPGMSQAEIWLEVETDDAEAASEYFAGKGCVRRDEIEPLPGGLKGFWLANPANIIHLVTETDFAV